jgi:hypothetical protein
MNRQQLDDSLRAWLEDGGEAAPDRFVWAALDQIETMHQRPRSPLVGRFDMFMNKYAAFAGLAAAVLAVAVSVALLSGNVGGPSPAEVEATPSPSEASGTSLGTVTVTTDDCTIDGLPAEIQSGEASLTAFNDTPATASFDMFRLEGGRFEELVAHVADERAVADAGDPFIGPPSWTTSLASTGLIESETAGTLTGMFEPGTYAVVCLWKYDESSDPVRPFAVVGPIEVGLCQEADPACTGPLSEGTHRTWEVVTPFSFSVPTGWSKDFEVPGAVNIRGPVAGLIGIWPDPVAADQEPPCNREAAPGVGRTVNELIDWLVAHPELETTEPETVEIGGLSGQAVDVRVDEGVDELACGTTVNLFSHAGTIDDAFWWDISGTRVERLILLDAGDGRVVLIDLEAEDGFLFDAFLPAATVVIESFDFSP